MPDTLRVKKSIAETINTLLQHQFKSTPAVPGWCVVCGCHEQHLNHTETQQKRII